MANPEAVTEPGALPAEISQAIETAKTAASFQDAADALKKQASIVWDPAERERLLQAAYQKETEAHGESKKARIMASGWGQGAGFGVGVSAALGMGVGNLVGALLSGVVAVPGILVGSSVGVIHGPFIKLKNMVSGNSEIAEDGASSDELNAAVNDGAGTKADEKHDGKAHLAIVEAARELDSQNGRTPVAREDPANES